MRQNLAIFLWKKRMSVRIRKISDAVKLILDFWTALYIIVPLFIILFYTYQQWLTALPAWFRPEYELLLVLLLAVVAVKGNLRMYIVPADLVYLFPRPKKFKGLVGLGLLSSFLANSAGVILAMLAVFPLYMHLQGVSFHLWMYIGLWMIAFKMLVLMIKFLVKPGCAKYLKWIFEPLFFLAFILAWQMLVIPYIQTAAQVYIASMLGILLLLVCLAAVIRALFPVQDWEDLANLEAFYDVSLMGLLLGYAGQPLRKRKGYSFWSQRRLGIPFKKAYALIYFYVKYFLRNRSVQTLYFQLFLLGLLVVLFPIPYWVGVGFLMAIIVMLGFLLRSILQENEEKLKPLLFSLTAEEARKGEAVLYNGVLLSICVLPLLAGLIGNTAWLPVIGAILLLTAFTHRFAKYLTNGARHLSC